MNAKLEDIKEYIGEHWQAMLLAGAFLVGMPFTVRVAQMRIEEQQARVAAYELALKNYNPSHQIIMGNDGVYNLQQVAKKMDVYAIIGGKKVEIPISKKISYLEKINEDIPREGPNARAVRDGQGVIY